MLTPDQRAARGQRAQRLLDSEDVNAAIREAAAEITEAMVSTPIADVATRDALHAEYHALKRVVLRLRLWADDGLMAAKQAGR